MNVKLLQTSTRRWRRKLKRFGRRLGFFDPPFIRLRNPGLRLLTGAGIELGAFEHPARLPNASRIRYLDVITPAQAAELFPEVDAEALMPIDLLVDLDRDGLRVIDRGACDFVVACHVIEHLANPAKFVGECIRLLRTGGHLAIAAPDKNFTFDAVRELTPIETLHGYFKNGRPGIGPNDYLANVQAHHPEAVGDPAKVAELAMRFFKRREHLHIWTSATFREFLLKSFEWNGVRMSPRYEVLSDRNSFEYFGVWRLEGELGGRE